MKIRDIILEKGWEKSFKTTKTGVDPETGGISWDVEYSPLFTLNKNLDEIAKDFKGLLFQNPNDDKLKEFYSNYINFKKQFRTYITRTYGRS